MSGPHAGAVRLDGGDKLAMKRPGFSALPSWRGAYIVALRNKTTAMPECRPAAE
jgi:hypothetical protein